MIRFGECALDTDNRRLYRGDQPHELSATVFQVLRYFLGRPGRLVSKEELSKTLWPGQDCREAALESIIKRVRHDIGDSGHRQRYIRTVRGGGYRFVAAVEASASPASHTMPPQNTEPRSLKDATILVVDNEPDLTQWLSDSLSEGGFHNVLTTHDGIEALDIAAKTTPAMILLDLQLYPKEHAEGGSSYDDRGRRPDGMQILDEIRRRNIDTRVIMMSGVETDTDTAVESIIRGANDFLKKPFTLAEVLEKVRKHLIVEKKPMDSVTSEASEGADPFAEIVAEEDSRPNKCLSLPTSGEARR